MADYLTPTVVQPNIPEKHISPLEWLLLTKMFTFTRYGEELYFYSEDGPSILFNVERSKLQDALSASQDRPSSLASEITNQIQKTPQDQSEIEIDLSVVAWETLFQDIVRRADTLSYVTVVSSFTCTKMRPDAFGGMAVIITEDTIFGKSTNDFIEDFLAEHLPNADDSLPKREG